MLARIVLYLLYFCTLMRNYFAARKILFMTLGWVVCFWNLFFITPFQLQGILGLCSTSCNHVHGCYGWFHIGEQKCASCCLPGQNKGIGCFLSRYKWLRKARICMVNWKEGFSYTKYKLIQLFLQYSYITSQVS